MPNFKLFHCWDKSKPFKSSHLQNKRWITVENFNALSNVPLDKTFETLRLSQQTATGTSPTKVKHRELSITYSTCKVLASSSTPLCPATINDTGLTSNTKLRRRKSVRRNPKCHLTIGLVIHFGHLRQSAIFEYPVLNLILADANCRILELSKLSLCSNLEM